MKHNRTYGKWSGRIALGFVVAAIAAPGAHAYYFDEVGTAGNVAGLPSMDELQQLRSVPSNASAGPTLTHPLSFQPSNEPAGPTVVIPDPTRGLPSIEELQQFSFQPNAPEAPVAVPTSGRGINWTDAGIGAGIAIATMLLALAAALGLRHHRRLAHS
jgi:hypothetical protein